MVKAKKAPQKKITATARNNRNVRIASALFVALGVLVVLSMIISSVVTQNPQAIAPVATAFPTAVMTVAP